MAKSGYAVSTGGVVSLSAASAKHILGVKAGTGSGIDLKKIRVAFDGVTASDKPVLVEVCACSFASNGPGTNSTSVTPVQVYGRLAATGITAAKDWSSAPTVAVTIEEFLLTPNGGLVMYDWPLGDTPDSPLGEGFTIRCTAPESVNVRATMIFERC